MKNLKLILALLISIAFGTTVLALHGRNHHLVNQLNQKNKNNQELSQKLTFAQTELKQTQIRLAVAENKLGFLDKNKTAVQVTAYTRVEASNAHFSNGRTVSHTYAVAKATLPDDHIVYIALSPTAQSHLHARINDYIVLLHKRGDKKVVAQFVDIMPSEQRAVIDVYFADQHQAFMWGRRADYYAVNISSVGSPFRRVLGE